MIEACLGRTELVIAAISDIHHSEFWPDSALEVASRVRQVNPDILILAGDLGEDRTHFREALDIFHGPWSTLVLPGNHDLWSPRLVVSAPRETASLPTSQDLWDRLLPEMVRASGAVWLEDTPVIISGARLAITGTIGWYDYSGEQLGRSVDVIARDKDEFIKDGMRIDWNKTDQEFSADRHQWLAGALAFLSGQSDVDQILVATHMVPFLELRKKNKRRSDEVLPYYINRTLGSVIAAHPKVSHTVSGHYHGGSQVMIKRKGMRNIDARILAESDPTHPRQSNEVAVYRFPLKQQAFTSAFQRAPSIGR
jgi:3',5'-cyclic AMP phosphodiesterase CpdA